MSAIQEDILGKWCKTQSGSVSHYLSVCIFALVSCSVLYDVKIGLIVSAAFLLITGVPKLGSIILYFLGSIIFTTIVTLIFPPLGAVLAVIFILAKIKYILENCKGLLCGILVYSTLIVFGVFRNVIYLTAVPAGAGTLLGIGAYVVFKKLSISSRVLPPGVAIITGVLFHTLVGYNFFRYYYFLVPVSVAVVAGTLIHLLLVWLYKSRYTTETALATMGITPLVILLMILPFVLNQIINDLGNSYSGSNYTQFETNYHSVRGHWRNTPGGQVTYVDPHIRTNPDETVLNNISFRGK